MTCLECRDLMLEVARRRAAPFVDRSVLAHVSECAGCRERLEHERALTAALGEMAREAAGSSASPEVERRLIAAFAAQAGEAGDSTHSSQRLVLRWLPAAAALLLAAGATAWWGLRSGPVAPPTPLVAQAPPARTPPAMPSVSATAAAPRSERDLTRRPPATTRQAARVPKAAPGPIEAVGFVPIPSAAGLPAFESGEIVRLGIPVTALPNYGVDIPAGGSASVQADLLVGQDGQARAIRLVTSTSDAPRPRHEHD